MKLHRLLLGVVCMSGLAIYAQEVSTPKAEVGLNYTLTRVNPGGGLSNYTANGGSGYVEYNLNHVVGLVADLGGNYVGNVNGVSLNNTAFTYLFGPRFNWRLSRFTPYVQVLVGGERITDSFVGGATPLINQSQNSFATAIGGGVDYNLTNHISIKPIQVEYLMTQFSGSNPGFTEAQNNLRYSAGLVFRFGSR